MTGPHGLVSMLIAAGSLTLATMFHAEVRGQEPTGGLDVAALRRMNEAELLSVYQQGAVVGLPAGRVRGTVLPAPGARRNGAMSAGARLVWQGKIVEDGGVDAVNRFFGVPLIRGRLYQGESWYDGAPALILDYTGTSRLYARNRDEIRYIGPGLYLGLMHVRTEPEPTLSRYFVLEVSQ